MNGVIGITAILTPTVFLVLFFNGQLSDNSIYATLEPLGDKDGDGLLNVWESEGYDYNDDGIVDLDLPLLGANPEHKDVFVEIDYMENHRPYSTAIEVVKRSFSNAPVSNPDGYNGINLHVIIDEQIPEIFEIPTAELLLIKNNHLGSPDERSLPNHENIIGAKQKIFHYALFAHTVIERPWASGWAPSTPGMEFIVTLGYPGWGQALDSTHTVGSADQQAGAFMHELGHTLGLHHGGSDKIAKKVNYLSVMNYNFQFADNVPDRPYDYSRLPQKPINENRLFEPFGIGMTSPPGLVTYINCPNQHEALTFNYMTGAAVDFNGDGDVMDGEAEGLIAPPLSIDLNCDGEYGMLLGQNDWGNLVYILERSSVNPILPSGNTSNMSIPQRILPYNITFNDISEEKSIYDVKRDRIAKLVDIINEVSNFPDIQSNSNVTNNDSENGALLPLVEINNLNNTLITMLNSSSTSDLDNTIGNLTMIKSKLQSSIIHSTTTSNRSIDSDVIYRIDNFIKGLELQR